MAIKTKIYDILEKRYGANFVSELRAFSEGRDVFTAIVEKTPLSKTVLMDILSDEFRISWIDINKFHLEKAIDLLPLDTIREKKVVPISVVGNVMSLVMTDVMDVLLRDEISIVTGYEIIPVLAFPPDIIRAVESLKRAPSSEYEDYEYNYDDVEEIVEESDFGINEEIVDKSEEAPIVKMANLLVKNALNQRASDIHIEPMEDSIRVRYRIDGALHDILTIPKSQQSALFTRLKIISGMDITEWRIPQDGRFRIKHKNKVIDFRVSALPTIAGEKFVLRVLDKSNLQVGLDELGFLPGPLAEFKQAIKHPYGLILVTGPTGSGKSTTLYSVLQQLNTPEVHIITVEDPVEYQVEGLTQIQAHSEIGLTFASALRAILRQSPDIVLVGEIRDGETADIAVKASLTGHLVLSTLHTNDAAGAITRLIDMGIEPFLVASSLILSSAQRLCRRICPNCKEEIDIPAEAFKKEGFTKPEGVVFYKGKGCEQCKGTGYYGRVATIETLTMNDAIRALILKGGTSDEIREFAVKECGMKTLRDNTFELFLQGTTTFEEVLRITSET